MPWVMPTTVAKPLRIGMTYAVAVDEEKIYGFSVNEL